MPNVRRDGKDIVIIGGPNGAGKTTAARRLVPIDLGIREFVNADEIARGLSPFNPDGAARAAGRLMLSRIQTLLAGDESFAFETTCSGRGHIRSVDRARSAGFKVTLVFLWLVSPALAIERVRRRVRGGGHSVPDELIVRRYFAGIANLLSDYLPRADYAVVYDNSDRSQVLIAERKPGSILKVHEPARWAQMAEAAHGRTQWR